MSYSVDWRQDGPDSVVVAPGGMGIARLFGVPFAAGGLWFLNQLLGGVLHPSEMTIFGWIILPLITAALLVPGWILLAGRKRTRLDVTRREATEEFDVLVHTRRKTTAIARDAHVLVRYEEASKGDANSSAIYTTNVYIDPRGAGPAPGVATRADLILLGIYGATEKPRALELAQKAAALLGIDVQDRCYEDGDVEAGVVVGR